MAVGYVRRSPGELCVYIYGLCLVAKRKRVAESRESIYVNQFRPGFNKRSICMHRQAVALYRTTHRHTHNIHNLGAVLHHRRWLKKQNRKHSKKKRNLPTFTG